MAEGSKPAHCFWDGWGSGSKDTSAQPTFISVPSYVWGLW